MFVGDIFVRWLKVIMYSVRKVGRAGRDISVVTFTVPSQPGAGCNRLIGRSPRREFAPQVIPRLGGIPTKCDHDVLWSVDVRPSFLAQVFLDSAKHWYTISFLKLRYIN